jgi:hypothetical protein
MEIQNLTDTQVSDLFFNFEKPNLDEYIKAHLRDTERQDTEVIEEQDAALRADAQTFVDIVGGQVTVEELMADYMRRL